jgi:hypothetical protein
MTVVSTMAAATAEWDGLEFCVGFVRLTGLRMEYGKLRFYSHFVKWAKKRWLERPEVALGYEERQ